MRDELDIESRELCPDGACIGVIGANGTCKVCGKPGTGKPFRTPADGDANADADASDLDAGESGEFRETADDSEDAFDDAGDDDEAEAGAGANRDGDGSLPSSAGDKSEWAERRLCPDEACIGVIGPDGRCKVCGKRA